MRFLFLGDVVGKAGRQAIFEELPKFREKYKLDLVVINGENAAGGFGITEKIHEELLDAGADVVTTGNHVWDQREILVSIERQERLLRPLNFPEGTPGRGAQIVEARNGASVLVMNLMGRVFMNEMNCPFEAVDRELAACRLGEAVDAIIIDMHAEATSEKQAMGHFVDGRVSCIVGTHTHTPTADDRILPNGTAYMSDAGMCGDYDSVLGMDKTEPVNRFVSRIPSGRFEPALGEASISGLAVEIDDKTGLALRQNPLRLGRSLRSAEPHFWVE